MNEKFRNIIMAVLMVIIILITGIYLGDNKGISEILIAITCGILSPVIAFFIDSFLSNIKNLRVWWISHIRYRNKKIRVSMAYLFRIYVDGKYLLVKNSKLQTFQPVGGVYKVLNTDVGYLVQRFEWDRDNKYSDFGEKKHDLRGIIPALELTPFIRWFESQKQREITPWREFYEELIREKVLRIEDFPYFEYRHLYTKPTLEKCKNNSSHVNTLNTSSEYLEYHSFDIIDFIATDKQEQLLKQTQTLDSYDQSDSYYKWISEEAILNNGKISETAIIPIANHTQWIVKNK